MHKNHPIYAFPDASITIVNENVSYSLHRSLLELASPTFVASLSLSKSASLNSGQMEYVLPPIYIRNEELDVFLGHLYHLQ